MEWLDRGAVRFWRFLRQWKLGTRDGKMATYLKPMSKLFDLPSRASAELNIADLMCPVCRGILIEPVTLPCTHSLCLRCLNGTIQHNSLSCPLCRVRVGSWLRTATRSDTLVNNGLWKFIKTRYSKEIQAKHDGEETDLDSGYVTTTGKILSAAGEIRREYEAQVQQAEEERRRRREAERIASEELIRKIQAEERQRIAQLTKDRTVAKNLAKQHPGDEGTAKNDYADVKATRQGFEGGTFKSEPDKVEYIKLKDGAEWNSNIALISKLRAERYASNMKSSVPNTYKCTSDKFLSQKIDESQNSNKTVKRRAPAKIVSQAAQSYIAKPSCSNSKIYGTQSKEELRVPSDVLSRKKKVLGVEVCLAPEEDDRRIGSAESSGSHDSINIEIHHFKPIKAMPRTPLRTMPDGRQLDPKLIRVVALLKRVQNAVPKPPSPMQLKRLSVCSYSAFKGRSKKVLKPADQHAAKEELEEKPSTSHCQSQQQTNPNKLTKSQVSETVRRLDLSSEMSYDGNKNYTKNINRIINGTRVSKKLILDEDVASTIASKTSNGDNPVKFKRRKLNSSGSSRDSDDEESGSNSSANNPELTSNDVVVESLNTCDAAVENIAERIKKRKMCRGRNHQNTRTSRKRRFEDGEKKNARENKGKSREEDDDSADNRVEDIVPKTERVQDDDTNDSTTIDRNTSNLNGPGTICSTRRSTRNSAKGIYGVEASNKIPVKVTRQKSKEKFSTAEEDIAEVEEQEEEDESDEDEGIREQKRIERLLIQERKDFELAQRLQAKFDEMERISGRTRGSRRGGMGNGQRGGAGVNPKNIEQVLSGDAVGIRNRFTRQLLVQNKDNSGAENNKRRVTRRRCI